jgi:hypothetical protein
MDKKIKLELIEKIDSKELLAWSEVEKLIISGQAIFVSKLSKKAITAIKTLSNRAECALSDNDNLNLALIQTSNLKGQTRFKEIENKTGKKFNYRYLAQRASIVDSIIRVLSIKGINIENLIENTNNINLFKKGDLL